MLWACQVPKLLFVPLIFQLLRPFAMVLLSVQGLPAAQIAGLLECHPATVRRWVGRFIRDGAAGLTDRPRSGRPRLGGRRLARRVAVLLERLGPWTLPRIWRYLGRPQVSMRTL
jgi:transposase